MSITAQDLRRPKEPSDAMAMAHALLRRIRPCASVLPGTWVKAVHSHALNTKVCRVGEKESATLTRVSLSVNVNKASWASSVRLSVLAGQTIPFVVDMASVCWAQEAKPNVSVTRGLENEPVDSRVL